MRTYIPPNMDNFFEQLGLVSVNNLSRAHKQHRFSEEKEIECIDVIIDGVVINNENLPLPGLQPGMTSSRKRKSVDSVPESKSVIASNFFKILTIDFSSPLGQCMKKYNSTRKIATLNLQRPKIRCRSVETIRTSQTIQSNVPIPRFNKMPPVIESQSQCTNNSSSGSVCSDYSRPPRAVRPSPWFAQFYINNKLKGGVIEQPVARVRLSERNDVNHVITLSSDSESEIEAGNGSDEIYSADKMDCGNMLLNNTSSQKMFKMLIRCHVCKAEITFGNDEHHFVQVHYKEMHNIHNIELVKQIGPNGKPLLKVVEMPIKPFIGGVRSANHVVASRSNNAGSAGLVSCVKPLTTVNQDEIICLD